MFGEGLRKRNDGGIDRRNRGEGGLGIEGRAARHEYNGAVGLLEGRCCDLDDQGLYWLEGPILYNDIIGYREIAKRVSTPIQMGENFYSERDLMNFVLADATHYVMADLMRIGGITGWLALQEWFRRQGVRCRTICTLRSARIYFVSRRPSLAGVCRLG